MILPDASDFNRDCNLKQKGTHEKLVPLARDRTRFVAIAAGMDDWPWKSLGPTPLGRHWEIVTLALVQFAVICVLMQPSEIAEAFELRSYKWIYWILLYSCLFLVCFLVTHIGALWMDFRAFLQSVDRIPFKRGFCDLKSLTQQPLWKLASSGRQEFIQVLSTELDGLPKKSRDDDDCSGLASAIEKTHQAAEALSGEYERVMKKTVSGVEIRKLFHDLQKQLAKTASAALIFASERWRQDERVFPLAEETAKDSVAKGAVVKPPATDPTLRSIERFLCLFYLNVILVPLRRLQTLILALAGVFVFVLLSYSSYPFESRESFHVLLIAIFFVISLIVGIVYGQMYSNPLLSRITSTTPGELGLDFWVRLGTFVFIPLLSLLSVQFPEINNFLFSWLQPALQSVK
jgi:hypothetical protein